MELLNVVALILTLIPGGHNHCQLLSWIQQVGYDRYRSRLTSLGLKSHVNGAKDIMKLFGQELFAICYHSIRQKADSRARINHYQSAEISVGTMLVLLSHSKSNSAI